MKIFASSAALMFFLVCDVEGETLPTQSPTKDIAANSGSSVAEAPSRSLVRQPTASDNIGDWQPTRNKWTSIKGTLKGQPFHPNRAGHIPANYALEVRQGTGFHPEFEASIRVDKNYSFSKPGLVADTKQGITGPVESVTIRWKSPTSRFPWPKREGFLIGLSRDLVALKLSVNKVTATEIHGHISLELSEKHQTKFAGNFRAVIIRCIVRNPNGSVTGHGTCIEDSYR